MEQSLASLPLRLVSQSHVSIDWAHRRGVQMSFKCGLSTYHHVHSSLRHYGLQSGNGGYSIESQHRIFLGRKKLKIIVSHIWRTMHPGLISTLPESSLQLDVTFKIAALSRKKNRATS